LDSEARASGSGVEVGERRLAADAPREHPIRQLPRDGEDRLDRNLLRASPRRWWKTAANDGAVGIVKASISVTTGQPSDGLLIDRHQNAGAFERGVARARLDGAREDIVGSMNTQGPHHNLHVVGTSAEV
jgi:hypothetical protein